MSDEAWIWFFATRASDDEVKEYYEYLPAHLEAVRDEAHELDDRYGVKYGARAEVLRMLEWKIGVLHHELKVRAGIEQRALGPWLRGNSFEEWDGSRFQGVLQVCRFCYEFANSFADRLNVSCPVCHSRFPIELRTDAPGDYYEHIVPCKCGFNPRKAHGIRNHFTATECQHCHRPRDDTSRFDHILWARKGWSNIAHAIDKENKRIFCGGKVNPKGWGELEPDRSEWRCVKCLNILKKRESEKVPNK